MPHYHYTALAEDGSRRDGDLVASGMEDLLAHLRANRRFPLEIRERSMRPSLWERFRLHRAAGLSEIASLSYQMATMIGAGLAIHETFAVLASRTRKGPLARVLRRVSEDIEAGNSLGGALGRYRGLFGTFFISIVKAGEDSGQLDKSLEHVADQYDEQAQLTAEIQGILVYPAILAFMALGVVSFLMTVILPRFVEHFETLGAEVPRITRFMLDASSFLRSNRVELAVGAAALAVTAVVVARLPGMMRQVDGLLLRLPLIGSLIGRREAGRFATSFSLLQGSGVPLLASLDLCADVVSNRRMSEQIRTAREGVEGGQTLEQAMSRADLFPSDLVRVIAVGEKTGSLAPMVGRIGRAYDREVRRESRRLVTFIEPALIVILGVIVGFVALSLVVPMVRATKAIHG
jgi:type IV pilus assembly protein PilC